ncbi:438_t:CDS:2 [Funneliformis caledonium]|uniref:438_t:CDS:1 n=1 Tax=Funneliformis caledonium TaxID=1117310 RepID=A0A9N9BM59_9GLOM|nr:438_t:CDS:2 [Funneliformis caledonium]
MNILPHKSYHVYNLKNKERVRKDEEKAKQEEEARGERANIARAKQRQAVTGENKDEPPEETSNQNTDPIQNHINFWADLEKESLAVVSTNPEYEAEKRAKEKKWEKQFTMYLGDVVKEQRPWSKVEGSVSIYDPLLIMKSKLDTRSKKKNKVDTREKRDRSYNKGKESNSESSSPSSIEKLRSERLAREKKERLRVQKLLNPHMVNESEPTGRYHSQFNPNATKAAHELSEQSSSDRYNNRYRSRRYKPY